MYVPSVSLYARTRIYLRHVATRLAQLPAWFEAMLVLLLVRLGLARLRYPTLLQWLEQSARRLQGWPARPTMTDAHAAKAQRAKSQVVDAVRRARRYGRLNFACLEEALTIQWMLRRRAVESDLRIGVRRTDDDQLLAHAWIECAGEILSTDLHSPAAYVLLTPTTDGLER
jgi:hypothetical protein